MFALEFPSPCGGTEYWNPALCLRRVDAGEISEHPTKECNLYRQSLASPIVSLSDICSSWGDPWRLDYVAVHFHGSVSIQFQDHDFLSALNTGVGDGTSSWRLVCRVLAATGRSRHWAITRATHAAGLRRRGSFCELLPAPEGPPRNGAVARQPTT